MGYSCAVKASLVLDALGELLRKAAGSDSSNAMPGGFWESSRVEHDDGAITGTVFREVRQYTDAERAAEAKRMGISNPEWIGNPCRKAGGFKISGEGKVVRFACVAKAMKAEAEKIGATEFAKRYSRN